MLLGPHTVTACTPNAFNHSSDSAAPPGPLAASTLVIASCWVQLGVVEYDPPESCGASLKTFNHCAIEPGTITRCPGMFASTHFATRYSILRVMSTGFRISFA